MAQYLMDVDVRAKLSELDKRILQLGKGTSCFEVSKQYFKQKEVEKNYLNQQKSVEGHESVLHRKKSSVSDASSPILKSAQRKFKTKNRVQIQAETPSLSGVMTKGGKSFLLTRNQEANRVSEQK